MTRILKAALAFAAAGRILTPDIPHPYAPEYPWPGSCWCGQARAVPVHGRTGGPR